MGEISQVINNKLKSYNIVGVCASAKPRPVDNSYMPVFSVGYNFGKLLSSINNCSFYETTHQENHIEASLFNNNLENENKFLAVHMSGGTTEILLVEKKDYTVSYKNNQNAYDDSIIQKDWKEMVAAADGGTKDAATKAFKAKAPQVILKMKGAYSGSKTLYFQIKKANIEGEDFYFDNLKATYTGKKQKAGVTVLWNVTGKALKLNKEYTLTVEEGKALKDAGEYKLTLEGTGNFTGRPRNRTSRQQINIFTSALY